MHKWDNDIPVVCIVIAYHHPICAFGPKYDFTLIFIKNLHMDASYNTDYGNCRIMLFLPPEVVAMLFFLLFEIILKFFIDMAFINEPYDLITTETIDQIFTFREISF